MKLLNLRRYFNRKYRYLIKIRRLEETIKFQNSIIKYNKEHANSLVKIMSQILGFKERNIQESRQDIGKIIDSLKDEKSK